MKYVNSKLSRFFHDTLFFILFFIFIIVPAFSGVYDGSRSHYESLVIDHDITPEKAAQIEKRILDSGGKDKNSIEILKRFSWKTVFWQGNVLKFLEYPDNYWLLVKTDSGKYFWVYAKKNVRNLDFDRTGYRVGVKGNIVPRNNRICYIKALSVVLIAPSPEISYLSFIDHHKIPVEFTIKTPEGNVSINHAYYPFILHRIYIHNPNYNKKTIEKIAGNIIYQSCKYSLDPLLVTALVNIESAFDVDAVSSSGALGLGQLMPSTASMLGVDPNSIEQNIAGAVKYFYQQMRRWKNSNDQVSLALASYNAGPGAVSRYGGIPPYSETRNYIFFIKFLRQEYKKQMEGK